MSVAPLERIETERLLCERLKPEHGPETIDLLCDPRVARTLWPRPEPPTPDQAVASLASKLEHWARYGFGLWLLRDRRTGAMVGRGGLQHTFVAGMQEVEVGWAIIPERWGEGLATEMAEAALGVAFEHLGLPQVVAFTLPDNVASRRVMEKTGFTFECEIEHVGRLHVLYRALARTTADR